MGCTETPKVFLSTSVLLCVLQGAAAVGNRELAGSPNWFSCFLWQCQSIAVENIARENYSKRKTVVCHKPGSEL